MTSRSPKKRPTTRPSTSARRAADAYRAVADATAPRPEPLWLPAGWLAIVLVLTAAVAAPANEWRPRGSSRAKLRPDGFSVRTVQYETVGYEDDIAGPALRIASSNGAEHSVMRGRRFAQQDENDALQDAFERPFGAGGGDPEVTEALEEALERPFGVRDAEPDFDEPGYQDFDEPQEPSEDLFNDLPADPFDEPEPMYADGGEDSPADDEPYQAEPPEDFQRGPLDDFDREPRRFDPGAEEIDPPASDDDEVDRMFAEQRTQAAKDCAETFAELKADTIDTIDLTLAIDGVEGEDYPYNCSIDDGTPFRPRAWAEVTYMWKASGLCHKPLYFEDAQLERYGHSWGPYVQPLISGAHFFSRVAVLPYNMGLTAPNECLYTLGYYRPGDCAPYMIEAVPFTWRAAAAQASAAVGTAAILP